MTGTTAQPSHEPPHKRKGTGTHHTGKISGEKNNNKAYGDEGEWLKELHLLKKTSTKET